MPSLPGHQTQDPATAAELLLAAGIPASEVVTDRSVGRDRLLWDRGFFVEVEHPVAKAHGYPSMAFQYASNAEPWIDRPPPTIGQHNTEVFTELGLTESQLTRLRDVKIIGDRPLLA